tara:strand:+ start:778 stop:2703 length:1926 start_codon:yes stop_codon:yes gene_type:complete
MNDQSPANCDLNQAAVLFDQAQEILDECFQGRSIRKVLLVAPPDIGFDLFDYDLTKRGRSNNYPPYGLIVLGRHLINHGLKVRICNLNHEILKQCKGSNKASDFDFLTTWKSKLAQDFEGFQPDLVGTTCLFTVTHPSLIQVCQEIKRLAAPWFGRDSKVPLVIGGVHVTHDVENILDDIPEADFAFLNEAELSLLRFIDVVNKDRPIEDLSQIIANKPGNRFHINNRVIPGPEDLNITPAFELIDIEEYSRFGVLGSWYGFVDRETPIATVLSNRGCRAACTFCNVRNFNGVGVRHRSIDSVLEELSILKNEHGIGHFIWLDDDLLQDEKRSIELFNGMVQRNLQLTWDASNGVIAYSCKDEVISAANASGCIGMYLGIESGNDQILKSIKKPGTVKTFLNAAEVLRNYEQINTKAFLMIGFPGETLRMMFDTISLAEKMNLDWANIAILQPWKSTPIYEAMLEKGLLGEEGKLKTKNNKFAPYNLGPYSRQRAIEKGDIETAGDYCQVLGGMELDEIPDPDTLDDLWFYMNYRLNFSRLFKENRPLKLEQGLKWLHYLHHLSAPDNGFIMYFYGYLQYRVRGYIDPRLVKKFENRLKMSSYWSERCEMFGLAVDDLKSYNFPDHQKIRSMEWKIPQNFA